MIDDSLHARSILPAGELSPAERNDTPGKTTGGESGEASFLHVLKDSMEKVNQMQNAADKTIQDFSTGQDGVTLHQTMVAMAQADVSFQLMMQVRDRIVRAYQDVMNMPM
ncbi:MULTISPECIES: flagellar hook-basal body complex protein FliE [Leptospirillum]|jgi:flagellar hook-basal body complex protein FliE|uniref:Flagellar hook-basal body complex protein FliE n=3 Tax=Leptospirillum ferriphilum TaxID=178606 RepID=A0A059XT05_9BACT|nr:MULTISPECIES: flagellar hook-basal body complex protein FliE [Leptospirillum]EAY57820.1 MAG: Flagellar hook-basal body complex protein FliE [Leptospirillum rubarum]EIJ76040.1 MAG: Flagellar hook-basal body complex protein FliE [Leptospirillum sp. Group II 'C75']AFS52471.1 putative flagellar basal body protein FliE [Leptospirillum ferriphilum ML-04]AIA29943.1 flagellar basal body protein FliE [Leptospirillum ferriphilum YSK]OOH69682.1 flagellar hook-basal body complex protein FliE [Leptospir